MTLTSEQADTLERYRTLFNTMHEGFCVIEFFDGPHGPLSDYVHVAANPAYEENAGIPNVVGQKLREMVPDEADGWVEVYGRVLRTGEPIRFQRELVATKHHLEVSAFRLGPAENRQVAVLFKDVSDRVRAEDALREINETLEARVAAALAEREQAQEALRHAQKMDAVGQLTGGVAHDFNNLLTVIRGSVDLLRRSDLTPEQHNRYIDAIGDTADRAATLTAQLLAFARRQTLKSETFDVGASIAEAANILRTLTGSRIELELQTPSEPIFALADRSQLDTAVVNMAINARDAMNGEGRLTIAIGTISSIPAIRAHEAIAGDFVTVTITDTGSGIAPAHIDNIFEPFFTTKNVGEGTGLGLSQVFGFAKQSGGDIRVESQEGKGTTFILYLPRAYPEGMSIDRDEQEAQVGGDGLCVLVVEDNESVGEFATEALRQLGYDSILATNAEQALAELARHSDRFHVVFSDVVMPGMSGLDLAARIRSDYPDLPVVLTSGYSHVLAQNGQNGIELLHKPYSVEQLSRVLHKAISRDSRMRSG